MKVDGRLDSSARRRTGRVHRNIGSPVIMSCDEGSTDQLRSHSCFAIIPTIACLNRNRRLAKDVERTIEGAVTWLYIASVKLMSCRLTPAYRWV